MRLFRRQRRKGKKVSLLPLPSSSSSRLKGKGKPCGRSGERAYTKVLLPSSRQRNNCPRKRGGGESVSCLLKRGGKSGGVAVAEMLIEYRPKREFFFGEILRVASH